MGARSVEELQERADHILKFLEENCVCEIDPMSFYRFVFPEGSFEEAGCYVEGQYNGILREIIVRGSESDSKPRKPIVNRFTVTDDLNALEAAIERNTDEFVIMPPVSYAGKSARGDRARELYALVIDLDGIQVQECGDTQRGMKNLFSTIAKGYVFPDPTFIVMSGTGIHLYFCLDEPVKLYRSVIPELQKLKDVLTRNFWYGSITYLDMQVQIEPIVQPFRVVGTATKLGTKARAFVKSGKRVSLEYLNSFFGQPANLDVIKRGSKYTLEEAKELFPDWYKRKVVDGDSSKNIWKFNRAVYDSWKRKISDPHGVVSFGNRYWSLFILAACGVCCKGVTFEEVEEDVFSLVPFMDDKDGEHPFTKKDALAALKAYDPHYTLTLDWINSKFGGVTMLERTKRNWRKQAVHLAGARSIQAINDEFNGTNWRDGNGRKPKEKLVHDFIREHPEMKNAQIARELGISRSTVVKWRKTMN